MINQHFHVVLIPELVSHPFQGLKATLQDTIDVLDDHPSA
jgi:hypothetical protein